jgi:hypothetical protein
LCQDDNGQLFELRIFFDLVKHFNTVDFRHPEVEKQQIGRSADALVIEVAAEQKITNCLPVSKPFDMISQVRPGEDSFQSAAHGLAHLPRSKS